MKNVEANRPRPYLTSLNLFFALLSIMIVILALLYWRHILDVNNLWKADIAGLGMIFIGLSIKFYLNPTERFNAYSRFGMGIILLCVGFSYLFGFNFWWPLALIIFGTAVILSSWFLRREIQKRQIAQETLRENEIKYRHIIDNARSVIMEIGNTGKITFINKFGLAFFGYNEEEILGQNLLGTIVEPALSDGPRDNN
jgi:PAS domain-containing protein